MTNNLVIGIVKCCMRTQWLQRKMQLPGELQLAADKICRSLKRQDKTSLQECCQ